MMHERRFGKNCKGTGGRWQPDRGNMNELAWIDCDCHLVSSGLSYPNWVIHLVCKETSEKSTNRQTNNVLRKVMTCKQPYLFTPWTRILETLTGSQLAKKFPAFYGTRRFITAICKCAPPVPILSQINPVYALIPLPKDPS